MTQWTEEDSATYRDIAAVAVPRRLEMLAALVSLVPWSRDEAPRLVELGSGDGRLAAALLDAFPRATIVALDGSESMRSEATSRLARFGARARVASFDLAALDWWERLFGADVVVSALTLHHLNDAKKRYVYQAIGDRISARGALLIADLIEPLHPAARAVAASRWDASAHDQAAVLGAPEQFDRFVAAEWNQHRFPDPQEHPSALLHHLIWLKHAGFAAADCCWLFAGHAVFGGFKAADWAGAGVSQEEAIDVVGRSLQSPP